MRLVPQICAVFAFTSLLASGAPDEPGDGADAPGGGTDPQKAMQSLSVSPGLRVDLWAAEPMLANPVALTFDEKGRAYVIETNRRRTSVPDIRKFMAWMPSSLAFRTVEDRVAFLKKTLSPEAHLKKSSGIHDQNGDGQVDWRDWTLESERIKLLEDRQGAGHADSASVFAEGFHELETGVAAGVAARGDDVWLACIPDLWRIHGGKKEKLLTGFGVHIAYGGHDMHGVKLGPDGYLYWTIADCGAHVVSKEGKVIENPDSGAVFRCRPDGTGLELFATGLRNPQSLAFNDLGDLFTGDNNADGGDKARWTHIVQGADYGWRIGWQFQPKLGAWNSEGMWHLDVDQTHFDLLPPVGLIGHGPAGIAHNPGTGLPDKYRDFFFYADFPGGVRAFALQPHGASYTVENPGDVLQNNSPSNLTGKVLWGLEPSDVAFGTAGGIYVLDWVRGWDKTGQGRIFHVHDPVTDASPLVQETKKILAAGFTQRTVPELSLLLGHADQRVRLAAQTELVRRGDPLPLARATLATNPRLMRLHGIWGILELTLKNPTAAGSLMPLANDADSEVAAQWAKLQGVRGAAAEVDLLIAMLARPEPRMRFFASEALGNCGAKKAVPALFALLKSNADHDSFVRHAAVTALAKLAESSALLAASADASDSVRAGVLLAWRRQRQPEIARFLTDKNPQLVLEAARAIHDAPIPAAWPALAALAGQPNQPEALEQRAMNANFLLGTGDAARRLASVASNAHLSPALRLEAAHALASWNEPFLRDQITGLWRDLPKIRDAKSAVDTAGKVALLLLQEPTEDLREAGADLAGRLKISSADTALVTLVNDAGARGPIRALALRALASLASPKFADAQKTALAGKDKALREAARQLTSNMASPAEALRVNAAVLGHGSISEQQQALATIGAQPGAEADALLVQQTDLLLAGKYPAPLVLDLLEAIAQRPDGSAARQKALAYEATRPASDPLAKWRECFSGGDAKIGRELFAEKAEVACMRCHKVNGEGGDVGPDLGGISKRHDRAYILRSIVDPNADIAPGYENVLLTLTDGNMVAGLLNAETANDLKVASLVDGKVQVVKKTSVKERTRVPSAMPPGLADALGKRGLRDVVEYLSSTP